MGYFVNFFWLTIVTFVILSSEDLAEFVHRGMLVVIKILVAVATHELEGSGV